jgi:hypothetical protein
MDWRLKATGFRLLDLPGGDRVHFWLQRYVTKAWPRPDKRLFSFPEKARDLIDDCVSHLGRRPETVMEIGSGRDLSMPLALRRAGVPRIISSDIRRLARIDLINHAASRLLEERKIFDNFDDLDHFGITYLAPHYASPDDGPVDCSCSNEVLEHVPASQLPILLNALRKVTKGLTVHNIDYSDHYARSDGSLSRMNFLRYSSAQWRKFNSGHQYVNRLRHSDYVRLFQRAGFHIVDQSTMPGDPIDGVAEEFRHYEPSDLFAMKGRIVAA